MRLELRNEGRQRWVVDALADDDADALVRCLSADASVSLNTLRIPWPYTRDHATAFLAAVRTEAEAHGGRALTWAIRREWNDAGSGSGSGEGVGEWRRELVGAIGLLNLQPPETPGEPEPEPNPSSSYHSAEIGYWLTAACRNQGVATSAVRAVNAWAMDEDGGLGLDRVAANVFAFNTASERVLVKAGFRFERLVRDAYEKNGVRIDGKVYAVERPRARDNAES